MTKQQFIYNVKCHQRAVRRFLTALCCGDTAQADDLAQDTFVKAYLSLDSFRDEASFSTWIYRIAYNTFINNRRGTPAQTVPLDDAKELNGTERTDDAFRYQALYLALGKLNEKERTAILLHYMQGYAIAEIAEITASSVDAVKQQLSRGRQHLSTILNDKKL